MEIYLFRHGIAEDAKAGHPDSSRALTDEGKKKTAEVVKAARRAGAAPSLIISSPYKRALETAEIAADGFGYKSEIVRTEALVPHGLPENVWSELREYRDEEALILTGHEPLMGHLAAYLLASPVLRIEVKKSALIRIDVGAPGRTPHGTLRWLITPKFC